MGVGLSVTVAPAIPLFAPPLVALWGLVGVVPPAVDARGIVIVGVVFAVDSMLALGAAAGASLGRPMATASRSNG